MKLFIRPMNEADIDRVYQIEKASHKSPWSRESLLSCLRSEYFSQVMLFKKTIIGFAIFLIGNEYELLNIAVDPAFQGKGYGQSMLQKLLEEIKHSASKVWLEVREYNTVARRIYEKFGFKPVRKRKEYYPDHEDAIVYCLDL